MLALVIGAQRGVTAAGDSAKKTRPAQDTYTITQLDIGANVASSQGTDILEAVLLRPEECAGRAVLSLHR